jgi:DNA-binding response OmpR family regulator
MRVLLVDDDGGARDVYGGVLRRAGYAVDVSATMAEGLANAAQHQYDLFLIDQVLPDGTGHTLCRHLRRSGVQAPILMLSGFDTTADVVAGLEAGADAFLAKPCPFAVLLAQCSRLLSRRQPQEDTVTVGSLTIDLWRKRVAHRANEIDLTAKEYALLEYLARRPGLVIPPSELVEHLWDESHLPGPGSLKALVSVVRNKLGRFSHPQVIQTVRNRGYLLSTQPNGEDTEPGSTDAVDSVASDPLGF